MQMLFLAQWAETAELRQEAQAWLWICCPDLAEEWGVPQQEVGD